MTKITNKALLAIAIPLSFAHSTWALAITLVTPDQFRDLWVNDNRARIVRNYLRMSDRQLEMAQRDPESSPFLFNAALESGNQDVLFPTSEGLREGTIDGRSIHIATPYVGIFLEQMILNEEGEGVGKSEFVFSDYVVTGSVPGDNWVFSLGMIKSEKPTMTDQAFTIVRSRDDQQPDNMGFFLHLNYAGIQIGSYIDDENARSLYSLARFDLTERWHQELFLKRDEASRGPDPEESIQWQSTFDLDGAASVGFSLQHNFVTDLTDQTGVHLRIRNFAIDYINYVYPDPEQVGDQGINIELFWGDAESASIGLGYRKSYKDHSGYYVDDYPIVSFFVRATM